MSITKTSSSPAEPGNAGEEDVLHLDPAVRGDLARLLQRPVLLRTWVDAFGSPLNVVLPDEFACNADRFADTLRERQLTGRVYFAHKANRSCALVRRLAATNARLDVASLGELQHAVASGFTPERIMVTGPKTPELLWLSTCLGVTVNVDSLAELELLVQIASSAPGVGNGATSRVPLLLRFSAFETTGSVRSRVSRFGIAEADASACLGLLDGQRERLELRGVAYHLDTVGVAEKVAALDGCFRLLRLFQQAGHRADVIDIGGGFGVNYLAESTQWERYTSELTRAILGQRSPITWRGHGYGLRGEAGRLKGVLSLYPAYRPLAGPEYVEELLRQHSPTFGQRFDQLFLETMTEVYLEPGRAMLDQTGLVMCRVLEVRPATDGNTLVRLDLNHSDVSLEEHGVMMDPVVLPRDGGQRDPGRGYLIGNLCLESDFISRRQIHFRSMPAAGDLVSFVNTAGYFMDFSADQALQQRVARKLAVTSAGAHWCLDEEYWPAPARLQDPFALPAPDQEKT